MSIEAIDIYRLAQTTQPFREALTECRDLPCETPEQEAFWTLYFNEAKEVLKEIDAERVELKAPVLEACRTIDNQYAEYSAPVKEFRELAKGKLESYALAREEASRKLLAAAREAAEAGDGSAALALVQAVQDAPKGGGKATSFGWEVVSCDVEETPRAFLRLDDAAAKVYLKTLPPGTEPKVPGLTFARVASVRSTGKRK